MTTLEMIDNALRYGVYNKSQLIDCKAEIERLEKQNTLLKSALMRITDIYASSQSDQSDIMARVAEQTLKQCQT